MPPRFESPDGPRHAERPDEAVGGGDEEAEAYDSVRVQARVDFEGVVEGVDGT